jgi:hypothetical protein
VTSYSGLKRFYECENEYELAEYLAKREYEGYTIGCVCEIYDDGSRVRVAVRSNPAYKKEKLKLQMKKTTGRIGHEKDVSNSCDRDLFYFV